MPTRLLLATILFCAGVELPLHLVPTAEPGASLARAQFLCKRPKMPIHPTKSKVSTLAGPLHNLHRPRHVLCLFRRRVLRGRLHFAFICRRQIACRGQSPARPSQVDTVSTFDTDTDEEAGVFEYDCSGFVSYALRNATSSDALATVPTGLKARPRADDFTFFFAQLPPEIRRRFRAPNRAGRTHRYCLGFAFDAFRK